MHLGTIVPVLCFPETSLGQMLFVILCCGTDVKIRVVIHLKVTVKVEKAELSERKMHIILM
jgi:hypothetical protein